MRQALDATRKLIVARDHAATDCAIPVQGEQGMCNYCAGDVIGATYFGSRSEAHRARIIGMDIALMY